MPSLRSRLGFRRSLQKLLTFSVTLLLVVEASALIDPALQMQTGNPTSATADANNHAHYLIQRPQYAMDYNDTTHEANWVAWDYTPADSGSAGRSSVFFQDTTLPAGFYQVLTTDYSGSGYDRGHMSPSADRTVTRADNDATFYMSNMVPQTPDNNQGVWASFETYTRSQAALGNEILIISGPSGFSGTSVASGVAIPGYTWKIAVIVQQGAGTALSRITTSTRVITIKIPNIAGVRSTPWQSFVTSVAQIEADTGYTFFSQVPAATAAALKIVVDGQLSTGAPTIAVQPVSLTTAVGGNASFSVTAAGNATLTYQWSLDDVEIPDATDSTLNLINVQAANAGGYTVVITNSLGAVTSNAAVLSLTGLPPSITTQPASATAAAGSNVVFAVTAGGSPPLTYQWRKNGTALTNTGNVSGATTTALALSNVQTADMTNYDVVVTNSTSSVVSNPVSLTVTPAAPTVVGQPQSQTLPIGSSGVFTVSAVGTAPLSYQWRKAGSPLSGETAASLTLANIQAGTAGSYDVVVTNGVNPAATSAAATLSIGAIPPNIAVERVGDGTTALSGTSAPVTVQIYARTGGTALQTISFPSAAPQPTATPFDLTESGSGTTAGYLNLSSDGSTLVVPGYNAPIGTLTIATSSGATNGRAIGLVSPTGVVSTPLAVNMFSSNTYRSVTSNGVNYWASGGNGVTYITAAGAVTSLNGSNLRNIEIYNGTLYVSSGSTTPGVGVSRVGTAGTLPTTTTTPALVIPTAASGTGTASPYGFAISPDGAWAYIADDRTLANGGGIQKWKLTTGTWSLQYTLGTGTGSTVGARGLAVDFSNFNSTTGVGAVLTATTTESSNNKLIYFSADTGNTVVPVVLTSAGANLVFRGVDFAPATPVPTLVATSPTAGATLVAPTLPVSVTFSEAVNVVGTWFTMTSAANGPINPSVTSTDQKTFTLTPPFRFADSDTITIAFFSSQIAAHNSSSLHLGSNYTFSFTTAAAVAPQITAQPIAQTVSAGSGATFSVVATGTAPISYQWRKNGSNLTGNVFANSATLILSNVQAADLGSYDVVVTNGINPSAVSAPVALTVNPATPSITTAPVAQTVSVGGNVTLTVAATGTTPLSYQWRHNGVAITGNASAATATLSLTNVQPADGGTYDVVITNGVGSPVVSAAVQVTVSRAQFSTIAWDFTTADPTSGLPADVTGGTFTQGNNNGTTDMLTATSASIGSNGTYAGASGTNNAGAAAKTGAFNAATSTYFTFTLSAPGEQLQATAISFGSRSTSTAPQAFAVYSSVDGFAAPLATGTFTSDSVWRLSTPAFTTVTGAMNTPVTFRIYGYNGTGSPGANTANWRIDDVKLTVTTLAPVTITTQPVAQTATVGTSVSFNVAATGTPTPLYQWRKDGVAIAGATAATYTIASVLTADAGNYDVVASNGSGPDAVSNAVSLTVNKAVAIVSLSDLSVTYDGTPKAATVTVTPAVSPATVTYDGSATAPTNAGSYAVVATIVDANYTGSATGTLTIAPATATIAFSNLLQVYSGAPRAPSVTTTPASLTTNLIFSVTGTAPTHAGSYLVIATIADPNYTGTASNTFVIAKAPAAVAFTNLTATYDGTPKSAAASTTPASLAVSFTYNASATAPTNANSYAVVATVNDANYAGSASATFVISRAAATVALSDLNVTYDGAPKAATVTTTPASLATTVTYDGGGTAPTNAGSYAVVATVTDSNYSGAATGTLVIAKATATIALSDLTATYDGTPKVATATTTPAGLTTTVTYDGSALAPTNAGSYAVVATVNDANYAGSASGTLVIAKATATIALADLTATFDGTAKSATATTTPANLTTAITYDLSATAPTNAGSYAVLATVSDANYAGTATGTFVIAQAAQTIAFNPVPGITFGDAPFTVSATATSGLAVTFNLVSGPATIAGNTVTITGAGPVIVRASQTGSVNYSAALDVDQSFTVGKANQSITFDPIAGVTYGNAPFAVSGSSNSGLAVTFSLVSGPATVVGNTVTITGAGDVVVRAAQAGSANYNPAPNVDQTFTVGKANQAITFAALADTAYGAAPFAVSATSNSGLPVTFTIANGPATIAGNTVTLTSAGTVIVRAAQAGDANTNAAPNVDRTFAVAKATLTVTAQNATRIYGAANPALTFSYAGFIGSDTASVIDTAPVATTAAIATSNVGSYPITISGGADDSYTFTYVAGSLAITPASQTIAFPSLAGKTYGDAPFTPTASASSGLPITFSVVSGPASVASNVVTITGAGSVTLRAAQAGNGNFTAATSVDQTFTVAKAAATVALSNLTQPYTGTAKTVTVTTTPSGLAVSVTYNGLAALPGAAGSYAVVATVTDPNYTGNASGTLVITSAGATLVLNNLKQVYDGTPKSVTATTSPAGLAVSITYNGSATAPTLPGSYAVVATINNANYSGTVSGTLVISTAVLVRHAPSLNAGLDGSIQVLLPESMALNGNAYVSGDILVPGAPTVQLNGHPTYAGTTDATGAATPTNYTITLNGNAVLRHVIRRIDAVTLPVVNAPPTPTGTRSVSLNSASDSIGDFATLRNLTLNGNAGTRTIPAGTYGAITVNGNSGLILGVAGATTPAVYNLQGFTLNGNAAIQIVGPVVINLATGFDANSSIGNTNHPEWLALNLATGGFTLNGNVNVNAFVVAPNGTVTINGNSVLKGGVVADRLTLNGNSLLDTIP